MPELSQSVPFSFALVSIGAILIIIGAGVFAVRQAKKRKERT